MSNVKGGVYRAYRYFAEKFAALIFADVMGVPITFLECLLVDYKTPKTVINTSKVHKPLKSSCRH